jgi:bifunctional non-homologous end joining protein LigD
LDIRIASKLYPARFFAFEILSLDGRSLMPLAQIARKDALHAVMSDTPIGLVLPWRDTEGIALFREIQSFQQEGIMAKLQSAPYIEGKRVDWWLKVKNFQEGTFYVCGLTEGEGERAATFGSLILGELLRDGRWLYVGNVGSGFNQRQLVELMAYLGLLKGGCPFEQAEVGRTVKFWTKPVAQCEVRFLEWGVDGKLRFPTFRQLLVERRKN